MAAEDDVQRVLSLLKRAIRSSGSSQKEVDRQIGVQPGYLSQVMIGRLDLKLKHLLRALGAIDVDPAGFFVLAFPGERGDASGPSGSDVLNLLPAGVARSPDSGAAASGSGESDAEEDFQRLVARALAEELGLPPFDPPGAKSS